MRLHVLLMVAALSVLGCAKAKVEPAAAVPALTVAITQPTLNSVEQRIVASGHIAPWQLIDLGVELNGVRVDEVLVEPGDRVIKGAVLVRLDRRNLEVELAQSRAAEQEALASQVAADSAARRGKTLVERGLISALDGDQTLANAAVAAARVASAKAGLQAAQLRLSFATLHAPYDGVISERLAQPGQLASSAMPLLKMIRDGRLEWRAELAQADLGQVQRGDKLELKIDGGKIISGHVRTLDAMIDDKRRTGFLYADLDSADGLHAGMFVEGSILRGASQILTLPAAAIISRDGFSYVFAVQDDLRVKRLKVETGASQGDLVAILSGVQTQNRIVANGAGFLDDGDLVAIAPESKP
jgi:RND family efflux transporter MFP subunit